MESKKINQLATELSPDLSDLTIIGDPTTGISKKITLSQMASLFTGTVEEYANFAAFPLVGVADTIYIALDTNILYRWNTGTSAYVELSPNIVSSLVFNDANGFDGTINLVGSVATLTITTALTTGSVGFIGASGALLQDNANFFWDDTNNRLGLGTNAPTTALDVFGSGIIGRINGTSTNNAYLGFASAGTNKWSVGNVQSDHRFRIFSEANSAELITILQTGEFGIGIANPLTKLHIDGGATALIANLDANVSVAKSISFRSDNSARINLEVSGTESGSDAGADLFIRRFSDAGSLIDTPFTIKRSTGNIGIGIAIPTSPLHILSSSVGLLARFESNQAEAQIRLINTGTSGRSYSIGSGASTSSAINGFYIYDETATTTRLAISSTGVVTASGGLRTTGSNGYIDTDGTSTIAVFANITGSVPGIVVSTNHPLAFYTNNTEKMRLTALGAFCIGSTASFYSNATRGALSISGSLDSIINFQNKTNTESYTYLYSDDTANHNFYIQNTTANGNLYLATNSTVRSTITSTGQVFINTVSALPGSGTVLHVFGNDACTSLANNNSAQQVLLLYNKGTTGNNLFAEFSTEVALVGRGSIDFNRAATLVRYNTTSDANLKNIIGDSNLEKSINILNTTKIKEFSWKEDETNKVQIGVIAQELYETYKGAVSVGSDESLLGTEDYKSWKVDKTAFTFHLIAGWQKHEEIISNLEKRIQQLESK